MNPTPTEFNDVWSDRWLQRYATAQIKQQWGSNLTKFTGMPVDDANKLAASDELLMRQFNEA